MTGLLQSSMDEPPKKDPLWMVPFSIHAARGLIREQTTRRKTMFFALLAALLLVATGSTFLKAILFEHPIWFLLFWFACGWLTLAAVLLALFDLLMLRAETRAAKRDLARKISEEKR